MVATVQSDSFSVFMRKIGYSVGLSHTLKRLNDLAELYLEKKTVSYSDWIFLVHKKWRLENDHIGDVFGSLGYLQRRGKSINILEKLDAVVLAWSLIGGDLEKRLIVSKLIFLMAIIESDGEIFLNCLSKEFKRESLEHALKELVEFKRQKLFSIFRQRELQKRISRIVNIDSQPTNAGGAGAGGKLDALSKKVSDLRQKSTDIRAVVSSEVIISDDYFRKVPPTRQSWGISLGLCDKGGKLLETGELLLAGLAEKGLVNDSGIFVIWPFIQEVTNFRLNPTHLASEPVNWWSLIEVVFQAYGGELSEDADVDEYRDDVIANLSEMYKVYKGLSGLKAMLRKELPFLVFGLSLASYYLAISRPLPKLDILIERERTVDGSPLHIRSSRMNLSSIRFKTLA